MDCYEKRLFDLVERKAGEKYDGHFTILKFTGGWKGAFGTPTPVDQMELRKIFEATELFNTLTELLENMLIQSPSFWGNEEYGR